MPHSEPSEWVSTVNGPAEEAQSTRSEVGLNATSPPSRIETQMRCVVGAIATSPSEFAVGRYSWLRKPERRSYQPMRPV